MYLKASLFLPFVNNNSILHTLQCEQPCSNWRQLGDFLVGTKYLASVLGTTVTQLDFLWLGTTLCNTEEDCDTPQRYRTLFVDGLWNVSGIEPTVDLLLLAQGQFLQFYSLTTGRPHSSASQHELAIPEHPLILGLRGSWLLLSWLYVSPDIFLYHWPSGVRKQVRRRVPLT